MPSSLPRMKFHTMEVKLSEGQIVSYDGAGKLWFRDFCSCLDALDVRVGPCPHILYASFFYHLSVRWWFHAKDQIQSALDLMQIGPPKTLWR